MKQLFPLLCLAALSLPATAHIESDTSKFAVVKTIPKRSRAHTARAVKVSEIQEHLAQDAISLGISIVRCQIGDYSPCRGLAVALIDSLGYELAVANSGESGFVAFEGLDLNNRYNVKIKHSSYEGSAALTAGEHSLLKVEKK